MPVLESKQFAMQRNLLAGTSGAVIGLFFGVPPAWGAHTMGLPWIPYGIGVITVCLVVGLLIAYTIESLFPRTRTTTEQPSPEGSPIRRRLAEQKARLDSLAAQRERRGDSGFGMSTEERIVWAELLELELQDIDEQVSRRQWTGHQ
jgi:hypothetical protein